MSTAGLIDSDVCCEDDMKTMPALMAALVTACTAAGSPDSETPQPGLDAPAAGETARATAAALHYTADLRVMESFPVQLDARMQVHNPTTWNATLELPGGCPLLLSAYRDAARTDLAWDQGHAIVCTQQLQIVDLAPSAQQEFTSRSDARAILGDSLPDGTYHMSARLVVNDTVITRTVGAVQLAVPR
jgi:hypothetical protein